MEDIIVEPGIGVGPIKLGMTREEVKAYEQEWPLKYVTFLIQYEENKVSFIEVPIDTYNFSGGFSCFVYGIDVVHTKATQLAEKIDKISNYTRDEGAKWGDRYAFPEIGLGFWRDVVLNEEDLETEEFKNLDPVIQEDSLRNQYFSTVFVMYPMV
ncbi:hypothetical protein HP567_000885 [Brevibacillus sp. M2.1A]|uniref:hypothetical protein n=1 Tax=Brevibacillus TaxID=55080 RepID=UPI00156B4ECB|nr:MULTISPECIES: hypothetical protein [Brevibacillus]MBY0084912.1 hypothetical protein [Brevibacillus brevis]MCC8433176.1 hypothetical protein [Brevibacillus sp. M2.1A]MCE0451126.1 hypothetical protein [Brevibacillus sp. AF8]